MSEIHPDEAARTLAEVRRRREQIADLTRVPGWFHWTIALLAVVLAIGLDTRRPLFIGLGVTVFALGLVTILGLMIVTRWDRAAPRQGPRTGLAVVAFVALILLVNLPTMFALEAAGAPVPATIGALAGAVVIVAGAHVLHGKKS